MVQELLTACSRGVTWQRMRRIRMCVLLFGAISLAPALAFAQSAQLEGARVSQPSPTISPAAGPPAAGPGAEQAAEAKEGDQSKGEAKDKDQEKKDQEKKDGSKEESPPDSVKRPTTPPRVPDPREFDVRLDENELVRFTFHGQPWPEVLQWLATLGGYSLDWQELPNDYINVETNRAYTLPEVQDLFNRLLFERGYTMARKGQVLLVAKIDKLDPSLLPRIDESQLLDLPAHDFVKITFQLPDRLKANEAAEDVKPLLSRHAKVQPLMATNRLLVVGLVANLREVSRLINTEHAAATSDIRPREFPIRYARADQVADQVMILLGLDPSSRRTPQELQVEQQRLQLFAQMQQQGKDVAKYLRKGDAPTIFLAVNHRNNSILANAPREEMKLIERTVQMLDTPNGQLAGALTTDLTLKKYQLVTLKAEAIVTALEEIADLDPRTRLKMDTDARTVFASATARDHETIKAIIDNLDGSGRSLEVIWLRRLPADAVAVTVRNLMVGEEDKEKDNRRSYGYFSYGGYGRDRQDENPSKGFRVDADIENNRLLLWANATELKEVREFLVKLGEIPGEQGNPNTVRVLKARDRDATRKLIEQLRAAWPAVRPNELRIEVEPAPSTEADAAVDDSAAVRPDQSRTRLTNRLSGAFEGAAALDPSARNSRTPVNSADSRPSSTPQRGGDQSTRGNPPAPPVTVTISEDGRVILSSRDTEALDMLEDLLARIAPTPKDYEVFYLRNALASLVTLNLEEYFEETESKDNSEEDYWRGWYGFDFSSDDKQASPIGLSKRRKIRFIYDYDTNSILVSHASPQQLEIVRDLIKIYDKPLSDDSISARRFQMFRIKYAQADDVAQTIKDVYRDLLSSKDKVFEANRGEKEQSSQTTNVYRVYGSDDDKKPKKIKASFAGALSVGVDTISNTVIVSAQEEWMPSISEMIAYLDREAAPFAPTVEVINTKVDVRSLQAALTRALGDESRQVQIKQPTPQPKKPEGEEQVAPPESNPNDS